MFASVSEINSNRIISIYILVLDKNILQITYGKTSCTNNNYAVLGL